MWCSPDSCGTICVVVKSASELADLDDAQSSCGGLWFFAGAGSAHLRHRLPSQARPRAVVAASAAQAGAVRAGSWLVALDVDGFGKAALAVPLGANEPRQVVIALHGAADRPEWACGAWRGIVGPRPFVLCPRGVPRSDFAASDPRYTFGATDAVAAELRASLCRSEAPLRCARRAGRGGARGPRPRC